MTYNPQSYQMTYEQIVAAYQKMYMPYFQKQKPVYEPCKCLQQKCQHEEMATSVRARMDQMLQEAFGFAPAAVLQPEIVIESEPYEQSDFSPKDGAVTLSNDIVIEPEFACPTKVIMDDQQSSAPPQSNGAVKSGKPQPKRPQYPKNEKVRPKLE